MTPADARILADDLQARADHFGDRAGEGVHLGRAASALRDLAAQIDARDAVIPEPPVDEALPEAQIDVREGVVETPSGLKKKTKGASA